MVVKGSLRPAVRFEAQGTAKIGSLQRRNGTALRTLGDLDYKRSLTHNPCSAVQTFPLAGGPAVDHIRVEVLPRLARRHERPCCKELGFRV